MRVQTYHKIETAFQGCRVSFKAVYVQIPLIKEAVDRSSWETVPQHSTPVGKTYLQTGDGLLLQITGAGLWKSQSSVDAK